MATLSISSPGDYHYVTIPTNMAASLTGVGMGPEAPSGDAPLRYEDAAFLTEAYAERNALFRSSSAETVSPVGVSPRVSLAIGYNVVDAGFVAGSWGEGRTALASAYVSRNYGDPTATLLSGCVRFDRTSVGVSNITLETSFAWPRIFNTVGYPFVEADEKIIQYLDKPRTAVNGGTAIRSKFVADLYRDLAKLSRLCQSSRGYTDSSVKTETDIERDTGFTERYSEDNGWIYGTTDVNKTTETPLPDITDPRIYKRVTTRVTKRKARGFRYIDNTIGYKDVTGVVPSSAYMKNVQTGGSNSYVIPVPLNMSFNRQGGARIVDVKCYAHGHYFRKGPENVSLSADFVAELPIDSWTSFNPFILVDIGSQERIKALDLQIKKALGEPCEETEYEDISILMDYCPDPKTPPPTYEAYNAPHEENEDLPSYPYKSTEVREYSTSWDIERFYVVYDMEFNARVPESESGGDE